MKRWSNRSPTVEPRWAWPKTDHQAPTNLTKIYAGAIIKSEADQPAIKEVCKAVNRDWVNHQACSLSHNIHVVSDSFVSNRPIAFEYWKAKIWIGWKHSSFSFHYILINFQITRTGINFQFSSKLGHNVCSRQWMTFPERVEYQKAILMYKTMHNPAPTYLFVLFHYTNENHNQHMITYMCPNQILNFSETLSAILILKSGRPCLIALNM